MRAKINLLKELGIVGVKMGRSRSRNYTFTIHNQGAYNHDIKKEFYDYVNAVYPISSYIIVQELYPNADKTGLDETKKGDSHLQGNLYFKSQVDFQPLLKYIQKKYIETQTDHGIVGRTQLMMITKIDGKSLCAMDNYFKGSKKVGADPNPYTDMTQKIVASYNKAFNDEFNRVIQGAISAEMTRRNLKYANEQERLFFERI